METEYLGYDIELSRTSCSCVCSSWTAVASLNGDVIFTATSSHGYAQRNAYQSVKTQIDNLLEQDN